MVDITKTLWQKVCSKYKNSKWVWSGNTTITNRRQPHGTATTNLFWINMRKNFQLESGIWMDGYNYKNERKCYLLMQCSVWTQKSLMRDLHAADVRYHLDCWLGVTKIQACWSGAIATIISSILVQVQQTAQMVGYCYNKYECWSGASVSDMHAYRSIFNRHDC